jgi:5'-nucleotidase
MEILCTNDDGILSPGLAAAVEVARGFGDVRVVAPSGQQTAAGRSLMGDRHAPFAKARIAGDTGNVPAWQLDATPALVVRHAFATVVRDRRFDLAVSGINYGENIGYDISTSATVGAAIECAVRGIPAIAVSVQTDFGAHRSYGDIDWAATKHFLGLLIRRFIDKGGFSGFDVLKVDVPMGADERTEWKICRLEPGPYYLEKMTRQSDDAVVADMRLSVDPSRFTPGTDAYVLAVEHKVAVTPLTLDWTGDGMSSFFR